MSDGCKHKETELFVKDITVIFSVNYRTVLNWIDKGEFPNAYKCKKCGKIIIPIENVKRKLKEI